LKFLLILPLSPSGERGRMRGQDVRRKFSDLNMQESKNFFDHLDFI
jgi:hypothetical protein